MTKQSIVIKGLLLCGFLVTVSGSMSVAGENEREHQTVVLHAGEGEDYKAFSGMDHLFVKLDNESTNQRFSLIEDNMKKGAKVPPHLHKAFSETFYLASGSMLFRVDGQDIEAKQGTTIHVPDNAVHEIVEGHEDSVLIMIAAPGGWEIYRRAVEELSEEQKADQDFMKAFREKHDTYMVEGSES